MRSPSPLPGRSKDDRYSSSPNPPKNADLDNSSGEETDEEGNGRMNETLSLMQEFMVKKGVNNSTMTSRDLQRFLREERRKTGTSEELTKEKEANCERQEEARVVGRKEKEKTNAKKNKDRGNPIQESPSEVTIYKRAVRQVANPDIYNQIDELVKSVRSNMVTKSGEKDSRKFSSSSEDMDTSE